MCILVLHFRCIPGIPVLLGANRDERHDRPAAPPALRPGGRGRLPFLAPLDEAAGGTWIGLNPVPAIGALTNRSHLPPPRGAFSRGLLCAEALASGGAAAMARTALEWGGRRPCGGFNFVAVDARRAYLVQGGGKGVRCRGLPPGVHVLSNDHPVDVLPLPLTLAPAGVGGASGAMPGCLPRFLRSHDPLFPGGPAPCKHGRDRGTRSSTWIAISGDGVRFLHAPGPPCTTPYEEFSGDVEVLLGKEGMPSARCLHPGPPAE